MESERLDKIDVDGLDLIETILVYKLPHLSREEIKQMLSVYEVKLQDTRFYQEVSAEGEQNECIKLLSRQLRRLSEYNLNLKPSYKVSRPIL